MENIILFIRLPSTVSYFVEVYCVVKIIVILITDDG